MKRDGLVRPCHYRSDQRSDLGMGIEDSQNNAPLYMMPLWGIFYTKCTKFVVYGYYTIIKIDLLQII